MHPLPCDLRPEAKASSDHVELSRKGDRGGAGESSYSHFPDSKLGLAVVDRFSFYLFEFLQRVHLNSSLTLQDLLDDRRCRDAIHSLAKQPPCLTALCGAQSLDPDQWRREKVMAQDLPGELQLIMVLSPWVLLFVVTSLRGLQGANALSLRLTSCNNTATCCRIMGMRHRMPGR